MQIYTIQKAAFAILCSLVAAGLAAAEPNATWPSHSTRKLLQGTTGTAYCYNCKTSDCGDLTNKAVSDLAQRSAVGILTEGYLNTGYFCCAKSDKQPGFLPGDFKFGFATQQSMGLMFRSLLNDKGCAVIFWQTTNLRTNKVTVQYGKDGDACTPKAKMAICLFTTT
jgi:hypothetical protein